MSDVYVWKPHNHYFMRHIQVKKNKELGFSIIELLISITIISILATAIYGVFISISRASTAQNASAGAQQNVRGGLELMVQDIRMAGYNPNQIPNLAPIEVAESNKIRIKSDRNKTGVIDNIDFEIITYNLVNKQLRRILYEGTLSEVRHTIIENVTGLQFSYSGPNNSIVNLELTVEENSGFGRSVSRTLRTCIYCRNLGSN